MSQSSNTDLVPQENPEKEHEHVAEALQERLSEKPLTIVVFGASGHLARTKTYPSLADLFKEKVFPKTLSIIGYARSKLTQKEFHTQISESLKLGDALEEFLSYCTYFQGEGYGDDASLKKLGEYMNELENEKRRSNKCKTKGSNRLFYLATPPNVFGELSEKIKLHLSAKKEDEKGWLRVVVEKPFGEDSDSCEKLLESMKRHLTEQETYRIDHYLAKEMVQNLLVLRFSNTLWDNLWDRRSIKCVKISIKESDGIDNRGGYYDEYGVIRDVFQNHLLQVLSLVAMEAPVHLQDDEIRNEKVKVLKAIATPKMTMNGRDKNAIVVGQYGSSMDGKLPSYVQDPSIAKLNPNSKQITFVQMVLFIQNRRWNGVPFICKCGKALDNRNAEIRIQFKNDELTSLYPNAVFNELVIRLQPSEAIWLRLNTKTPGFARFQHTYSTYLDLTYQTRFGHHFALPAAYTRLLLDCLEGDQSLFVRDDELREAWRIVTPVLQHLQRPSFRPPIYPRGSRGPPEADEMAFNFGFLKSSDALPDANAAASSSKSTLKRVSDIAWKAKQSTIKSPL